MKHRFTAGLTTRERHYRRVLESALNDRLAMGLPFGEAYASAKRVAAATVNKYRAEIAGGKRVCRVKRGRLICRTVRGPRLVGRGGSRRQWYPSKRVAREVYACLQHERVFKNKAAQLSHYRSHRA